MAGRFFLMRRRPPRSTRFPYTTLFRSHEVVRRTALLWRGPREAGWRMLETYLQAVSEWGDRTGPLAFPTGDRKSTRLNSSHANISYAVFSLQKRRPETRSRTAVESLRA